MADKPPTLTDTVDGIIKGFYKTGGTAEHLARHFRDEKKYEKGIGEYRTLTSPEAQGILQEYTNQRRDKISGAFKAHGKKYAAFLEKKLGKDKVQKHHLISLNHDALSDAEREVQVDSLLAEMAFSGAESMYGSKTAKEMRTEYENGNPSQLNDFIEKYLLAATGEDDPRKASKKMAEIKARIASAPNLANAFQRDEVLSSFFESYLDAIGKEAPVIGSYQAAIGAHRKLKGHRKILKSAANSALKPFGHQVSDIADPEDYLQIVGAAHKGDRNYDPKKIHGKDVEPLPKK